MKLYSDINYSENKYEECLLDIYVPDNNDEKAPLFIYYHGGGLEGGIKEWNKEVYENLAGRGVVVVSAHYRCYPKAAFPDYLVDAAECVAWCMKHVGEYHKFSGVWLGGSSAGSYIISMLFADKQYLGKWGIGRDDIAGYLFDAGQPTVHFNVLRERGLDTRLVRIDEAAPMWFFDEHIGEGNPPKVMLIYSDNDMYNRAEQNELMYRTMLHLGYPEDKVEIHCMKGYSHTAYCWAKDEEGNWIFERMIYNFICGLPFEG